MRRWLGVPVVLLLLAGLVAACTDSSKDDPGALVRTTADSTVGIVLDEIPTEIRDRVASELIDLPEQSWRDRAATQLRLTAYRLIFREYFYEVVKSSLEDTTKRQLPLPPEDVWNIELVGAPTRRTVDGHDVVAVDYTFSSVLVTDVDSPRRSEPRLASTGGKWKEAFNLPIDPELLLQRTGYACMDESDYPFNSVDSEEPDSFYDQEAEVEESLGNLGQAHFTLQPEESCVDALEAQVGRVDAAITFERIGWDDEVAAANRRGTVTGEAPDLAISEDGFADSRVTYRYIQEASCEVAEEAVGGTGRRRLLQFETADENVGDSPLVIGAVDYSRDGEPQELETHNLFDFSPCHQHYHFRYYGDLAWDGSSEAVNTKKAFCLQSTSRAANREGSPLANEFGTCHYQGVAPGWLDEYKAGLPGQWLDTTDIPEGEGKRSFRSNPNGFLCEGAFVDDAGEPLGPDAEPEWVDSGLTTEDGKRVEVQRCEPAAGWDANNEHRATETILPHGQGLITSACTRGQIGPLRNCGFGPSAQVAPCVAGQPTTVTFKLPEGAAPQVVRLTDYSHALESPIPARYEDSWVPLSPGVSDQPYMLANEVVTASRALVVTFACPGPRTGGVAEPGGRFSVYTAPVFPPDDAVPVQMGSRG